jgi:hypothetical protein
MCVFNIPWIGCKVCKFLSMYVDNWIKCKGAWMICCHGILQEKKGKQLKWFKKKRFNSDPIHCQYTNACKLKSSFKQKKPYKFITTIIVF